MKYQIIVRHALVVVTFGLLFASCGSSGNEEAGATAPNVIYILADDLGYADLGSYGQEIIKTPNLDKLAAEGMRFTQHYSGSTVCAPSRSSLMTGLHTGHTYVRGNKEVLPEGQAPIAAEAYTVAELMKEAGYVTGAFGKWGLGMNGTEGSPLNQGFDRFFGYLCQRFAHRYYPEYIWDGNEKYYLEGNDLTNTVTYAPDVIQEKTIDFIRAHKDTSFFLYIPSVIPHAELVVPEDSLIEFYREKGFPETPWGMNASNPYAGNAYGSPDFKIYGYAPVEEPHATFAAMVSRLDRQVGEIVSLLEELGIADNTLIFFTSDNGPHTEGGADPEFFDSNGPLRGTKRDLYEGGIRVPLLAWWPGKIEAGTTSDHISAFWDMLPTLADLTDQSFVGKTDGITLMPVLLGEEQVETHETMYWEFYERGGRVAMRQGNWKIVIYDLFDPEKKRLELYDLNKDVSETNNIAADHPDKVAELLDLIRASHEPYDDYSIDPDLFEFN